ncbi:MAG: hypothetical protein DIZ80_11200 [endosymbiont of Galathealinum brachiosum]|uniref:Uncharacterized protein n=1 Tax=endosymbiont of Galathealinum brachiosum TaxID=2200906 RepID=A0A370DD74_9GAMM|nr:MAG: hypothetical protein DIZ80_11200 [endosymbiont of Galathealinum brachiosum]
MRIISTCLLILITVFVFVKNTSASTYSFELGGWSDGGQLSGQFETSFGAELNTYITTPEIISFEATYTGLYTFDFDINDLVYFGYPSPGGASFQLGTERNTGGSYIGDPFSFTLNSFVAYYENTEFSYTNENAVIREISAVPLPPSIILFFSGLIGFCGFLRQRN